MAPRSRGFSLIEIMTAMFVILMGLMGLYGAISYGLRTVDQGGETSQAIGYAREIIELVRARNLAFSGSAPPPTADTGLNDAAATRASLDSAPFVNDLPANTEFTRNIHMEWVSTASGDYRTDHLMRIVVRIYWKSRGDEKSVSLEGWAHRP